MDSEQANDELKVIRQLMQRPIRFSTLSGLSGIWAGLMALAGLAVDLNITRAYSRQPVFALWLNVLVWAAVFVSAAGGVWLLTRRREKQQGMPAWSQVKTRILLTILPPFIAGAGLTAIMLVRWCTLWNPGSGDQFDLVPAIWALFYGVALWQLGGFSQKEVRMLGAAFILAGLAMAAFFQPWPYESLGVTFGGFHLIYGAIIWKRYGG